MRQHLQDIKDHLYGPAGSVLLHVLIVFLLLKFVGFSGPSKTPELEVMLLDPQSMQLEELELLEMELKEIATPEMDIEVDLDEAVPNVEEVSAFQNVELDMDFSALDVSNAQSPLMMKGLYAGRSSAGRDRALRLNGGSASTERAVLRALEWLKKNQQPDGSWKNNRVAMTGLALLSFLAHGETPGRGKYGETVERAIHYLQSQQHERGVFGAHPPAGKAVYAHAIATYAMSEAYGLTKAPTLRDSMDRAVQRIIEGQQGGGGWDYGFAKGARNDLSVTGWNVQALKAAYLAGCRHPLLREAMSRSVKNLKAMFKDSNKRFMYSPGHAGTLTMTGVGVLALQFLGQGNGPEVQNGLRSLEKVACDWDFRKNKVEAPMYGWYYITQAKFHQGGLTWNSWNPQFARTMVRSQAKDGHWDFPKKDAAGHFEHGANEGPVFSTTLGALMLQVYYRNLPTFQQAASKYEEELLEYEEQDKMTEINLDIL